MNGSAFLEQAWPNLKNSAYTVASQATWNYNCFAFAAGFTDAWWSPLKPYYWGRGVPRNQLIATVVLLFRQYGFEPCADASVEDQCDKIALYADGQICTHAARPDLDGSWMSKLCEYEDITHHSLGALEGDQFGTVSQFMKKKRIS